MDRTSATLTPSEYPAGTFIKTEAGYFFVYSPTRRYRFITKRVFDSWSPQRLIVAREADPAVARMKVIAKMKFRDGSLLYSQATGSMYLVSEHKLCHITNPDWLVWLNIDRNAAVWVSEEEIKLHELGKTLD